MARGEIVKARLPLLSLLHFLLLAFAVQGRSPHRVDFKRPRFYPESFDWDPWHSHFVVGSISLGVVVSVSDAGVVGDLVADPGYAGRAAVLGVRIDARRRRILAAVDGAENLTALAAYSLDTGKRLFLAPLLTPDTDTNTSPAAAANDLAIDPNGNAYVTNSRSNFLWKVTSDGSASSSLRNPLFTSQNTAETSTAPTQSLLTQLATSCGLNGIAYLHGGFLLVGQTNSGKLFRVNLRDLDDIRVVHLNKPLVGIDGIAIRRDGALIAVSFHTAWLIRSRDSWISAEISDELPLNVSSSTTAVAFRENRPYVLHSYLTELIQGTADREMFTLEEIAFPSDKDEAWWLLIPIVGFVILVSVWRFQVNSLVKQMRKKRE